MKTKHFTLALFVACCQSSYSQITEIDNVGSNPASFVGWDAGTNFSLSIKHLNTGPASDINFFTGGNNLRMALNQDGLLGLGLNTHTSLLHLGRNATSLGNLFRTDGFNNEETNWQLFTGPNLIPNNQVERFRLYAEANATPWIGLQSRSNGMRFETAGANQRMRINGTITTASINGFNGITTTGFIGITPNASPWAAAGPHTAMHILDEPANGPLNLGYRTWMRIGTTYSTNSDYLYFGLRKLGAGPDVTESVIAFGDNGDFAGGIGPDQFVVRFINGTGTDPSGAGSADGLELMRFSGMDGGKVAVGDEFNYTSAAVQPQRRLHVHDPRADDTTYAQLRISKVLSSIDPVAVDFRSTSDGNLFINCYGTEQRVGIEEAAPLEKLDVKGNGRFQNIPNTEANCVILGQTVTTDSLQDNRLKRLDFNGDSLSYLAGNGTWQPFTGGGDSLCEWNVVNAGMDLATGFAGACREGRVGIGVPIPFGGKLDVYNDSTATGTNILMRDYSSGTGKEALNITVDSLQSSNMAGMRITMIPNAVGPFTSNSYGIRTLNQAINTQDVYGVYGEARNGATLTPYRYYGGDFRGLILDDNEPNATSRAYGVRATGQNDLGSAFGLSAGASGNGQYAQYGVSSRTNGGSIQYALKAYCTPQLNDGIWNTVYGVHSSLATTNTSDHIAIYGEAGSAGWAYYSNGPQFSTSSGLWQTSDANLKINVQDYTGGLAVVNQLNPKTYSFSNDYPQLNLPEGDHFGLISQDVENILPTLVKDVIHPAQYDEDGNLISAAVNIKAMNYNELHAIEIQAIKELSSLLDHQAVVINDLQSQLNACCTTEMSFRSEQINPANEQDVTLKNASIVLNQNIPNPMAEQTTISYNINDDFSKAQILFYDANGKLIQTTDITTKGAGQLNVFADDLTSGVYSYALVVDGKIIDTKKMVKQ